MNIGGIYLHIPYCRQACHYCNFHFSTSLQNRTEMIQAMLKEIELRKDFFTPSTEIQTIYFGGGTPSILQAKELTLLFDKIRSTFQISDQAEITIEINPEDITKDSLQHWKSLGVNRFSIGVQTFDDALLTYLNRCHDKQTTIQSLQLLSQFGFDNYSIDLIYGIPNQTADILQRDLEYIIQLQAPHVSAYALTIEEKTYFGHLHQKNRLTIVPEEIVAEHFETISTTLSQNGYEQYEISNYAKKGKRSRHNSSYWRDIPYLGIGPGAHSYNGLDRLYNIENNPVYIRSLNSHQLPLTIEPYNSIDRYNERLLTSIRTIEGVDSNFLFSMPRKDMDKFKQTIEDFVHNDWLIQKNDSYILSSKGKLLADEITLKLIL
ncbi:MAG: radical SAM family heme chaperone HemW [Cytophagaceae bacterium]